MTADQPGPASPAGALAPEAAPVGAVYRVDDHLVVRTSRGWYLLQATRPASTPPADALLVLGSR